MTSGKPSRAATESDAQGGSKTKSNPRHKASSSKPKVTFKSQTWTNSTSKPHASSTSKPKLNTADKRDPADTATTTSAPVTKHQSRFASLFISLLAVSPTAIEYDAADQKTIETAQQASTAPTAPAPPKKVYKRSASVVRPSEIRKTRWKRFKYEMGLKVKSHGSNRGKDRKRFAQMKDTNDVELEELTGDDRATGGAADGVGAKREDMA